MSEDLTDILASWEYDPENLIRIIKADNGREVLQVRQPLGIEQYELDGRPDGSRPDGEESFLELYLHKRENYKVEHGTTDGFKLSKEDFLRLQNEGILYYYRYLILFQTGDFDRAARDTDHNLQLCVIVEKHVADDKLKKEILQYRPYILRINAISKAMLSLQRHLKEAATQILQSAIDLLQKMPTIETPAFQFEKLRSLHSLRSTLKQILKQKESPVDKLKTELTRAVADENYEQAAMLRDRILKLEREDG
jgi:hypothetical protein